MIDSRLIPTNFSLTSGRRGSAPSAGVCAFLWSFRRVGKTYAMLEAAHNARTRVVRYSGRLCRTARPRRDGALLEGLERLPNLLSNIVASCATSSISMRLSHARPGILARWTSWPTRIWSGAAAAAPFQALAGYEELLEAGHHCVDDGQRPTPRKPERPGCPITGIRQVKRCRTASLTRADEIELIDLPPDDLACAVARRQGLCS